MAQQERSKSKGYGKNTFRVHDWKFELCEVVDDRYLANGNEFGVISGGSVLNAAKPEGWPGGTTRGDY